MKPYAFLAFFMVFSSLALGQSIDKVIVVSDVTSADFMIAKAAGDKAGIPVLVAAGGEITDELRAQLAELMPATIILMGGPAVIRSEAEQQLGSMPQTFNVIRVWGLERTGTAVEAARLFWREGADCAVLVDDTRDSDADTELQESASVAASQDKCVFLPVPRGSVPAEALLLLQDLGVISVRFMGAEISADLKEKLRQFRLKETTGSREKIEAEIESEIASSSGRDLRIVIVAAPHWRHVLGTGGHLNRHTIVRIVNSANRTDALAELIKSRNISDVRVVGFPALADEIAGRLSASGIAVKKVSGEKAGEVAHKVLKELAERWRERQAEAKNMEKEKSARIREKLLGALNNTEAKLDTWSVELERLADEGANPDKISQLKERLAEAKSRTEEIKRIILAGKFDEAERLLHEIENNFEKLRFVSRKEIKLRIENDIEAEESSVEKIEVRLDITDIERKLPELRQKCMNITSLEALVEKAKSLRDDVKAARSEGNHTRAAGLAREAHGIAEQARSLGDICAKRREIPEKLHKIAEKQAERAEKIREKMMEKPDRQMRETEKAENRTEKAERIMVERIDIDVIGLPGRTAPNETLRVTWRVKSSSRMQATHTAVHYDYSSHPGTLGSDAGPAASGYPFLTPEFASGNFTVSNTFVGSIAPDREGTLYMRAHTVINGKNYWTEEKQVEVRARQQRQEPQEQPERLQTNRSARQESQRTVSYTVEADDSSLYPRRLEVPRGTMIRITFKVRSQGVYYGGLDFRSSKFTTGTVLPGMEKTVEFTVDESFRYTSYWPVSDRRKADGEIEVR